MRTLQLETTKRAIQTHSPFQYVGRLKRARGLWQTTMPASMGDACEINSQPTDNGLLAEVTSIVDGEPCMMLLEQQGRLAIGAEVMGLRRPAFIPCGESLLGRVIDGLGRPIDERGPVFADRFREDLIASVPSPLKRRRIQRPMVTGVRAIDGLLTCGIGQRLGLFAGSGVGKSTLLGEIAKNCQSTRNVIVLVGERGREVAPFVEDCLGANGLARSVVVVSTCDQPPQMRVRAVRTGMTIANDFRSQGHDVLFLLDSMTRMAMAQREVGLSLGEPPTNRGYTPSVFQLIANVLEQLGSSDVGSVTAIVTVLVDGDDMNDPIADSVRSVADGHIVLDRELAARGHFPAIDVGASLSRVFREVTDPNHQLAAQRVRQILATYARVEDLIQAGAYEAGASLETDRAIALVPRVEQFLRQSLDEKAEAFDVTLAQLQQLATAWEPEANRAEPA